MVPSIALLLGVACSGAPDVTGQAAGGGTSGAQPGTLPGAPPATMTGAGGAIPGSAAMPPPACTDVPSGPTPLRRLTRFEYNNTVRDLLGDSTSPADALPAEALGNGFGNDAAAQPVSSLLAEQYGVVATAIAARAVQSPSSLAALAPCARAVTPGGEEACARTIIEGFVPRAYRRPLLAGETDDLLGLYRTLRATAGASFATAVGGLIEALLQAPDFLYRVEAAGPGRMGGDALAVRLSYFLWGTMPDEALRTAARSGGLQTRAQVAAQAQRMLDDPRARQMVRFFFDNLLPITGLSDLERDPAAFPRFNAALGALMREETQRLLEHEIFDPGAGAGWASALTAPYTFVNGPLAAFYQLPGVQGAAFQKVMLPPGPRRGILTHASLMAGTTHSNHTNPVVRGSFVVQKLLCLAIPLPDASIAARVKPPDPYSGKTARERFGKHSADPVCRSCHSLMDPVGLAFENFDAVGQFRNEENGVVIDARGALPGGPGPATGPAELVQQLAGMEAAQACFASHWIELGFGKSLGAGDECLRATVSRAFADAGHDVRKLLLALTQTDRFMQE